MRRDNAMSALAGMALAAAGALEAVGPSFEPSRNPSRGTGPGRQRAVARLAARAEQVGPAPDSVLSRQRRRWIERHYGDLRA